MNPRPNIVLVTIDSLRADYVHTGVAQTPTHDALAKEGTRYTRTFAQGPYTTFSMPSLFTGQYPNSLRYVEFSENTVGVDIGDQATIPEVLSERDYRTAGFHSNPLLSNLFGFGNGFDVFEARLPFSGAEALPDRLKILIDKLLRGFRKHAYLPAEKVNDRALSWIDSCDDEPFFLWVHYMDVHGPYQAKSGSTYLNKYRSERLWRHALTRPDDLNEDERERLRDLYRAEVEYTDDCLGQLVDDLRGRGVYGNTITFVTADHGEQFGEHGRYSHPHQLYDELTHVPLVVRDPTGDGTNGGTVVEDVTELLNVSATILDRAGATVPDAFEGSPLPVAADSEKTHAAVSEADLLPAHHGSIRTDQWRFIRNEASEMSELYRLTDDPNQQRNRVDEFPLVSSDLADRLETHVTRTARQERNDRSVTQRDINDGDVRNRLEELGYLE